MAAEGAALRASPLPPSTPLRCGAPDRCFGACADLGARAGAPRRTEWRPFARPPLLSQAPVPPPHRYPATPAERRRAPSGAHQCRRARRRGRARAHRAHAWHPWADRSGSASERPRPAQAGRDACRGRARRRPAPPPIQIRLHPRRAPRNAGLTQRIPRVDPTIDRRSELGWNPLQRKRYSCLVLPGTIGTLSTAK